MNLVFEHYRAGVHFHDRFYLAQHSGGYTSGLFGPSLNGLSDNDFALVGGLERGVIDRLKSYFQL